MAKPSVSPPDVQAHQHLPRSCIYVDHDRRYLTNMILLKCVANVSLLLVLHTKFRGWAKTRQLLSAFWGPQFSWWSHDVLHSRE